MATCEGKGPPHQGAAGSSGIVEAGSAVIATGGSCSAGVSLQQQSAGQLHDQRQHWGLLGSSEGTAAAADNKSQGGAAAKPDVGFMADDGLAGGGSGLPCRKRKALEELPNIDEVTAERLRRATDSLTKEQMRTLLARACSHYPAVENALYSIIEADPSSRRLMVRNVPYSTAETALRLALETHGPIEDFKLVHDRNTGISKGFAFVTYKSMEDVARVLQSDVTVDGRALSIKLASQQDQGAAMKRAFLGPTHSCRLFVRNVPDTCDERRLKQEFTTFGAVKETAIVRNRDGTSRGYGFIVFEEPEALMKAASQSQRVIDGQVTFVSVASETRRPQQPAGGSSAAALPPQHLQQLPLGGPSYQQQQQQQQAQQQHLMPQTAQWPVAAANTAGGGRSEIGPNYGAAAAGLMGSSHSAQPAAPVAAAGPVAAAAAAAANPYMQQLTAALMPQLYMHHYQQQYLASTQANAAAAAGGLGGGVLPQQPKHPHQMQQHMQQHQ